jgi:esterase/lipase superfamily enzyme
MRRSLGFVLAVLASTAILFAFTERASAQKRVALVIGNSDYQHTTRLANPTNDARNIAATLSSMGFEYRIDLNLDSAGFARALRHFRLLLEEPGIEVGLMYYSGLAVQFAGQNYLMPIDARLASARDVPYELINLAEIEQAMMRVRTRLILVDAARDNPLSQNLGTRSMPRGLALPTPEAGTIISFSAQPGEVALDGTGANSAYTAALLRHLPTPETDVIMLLRRVRDDVRAQTGQEPWETSSLGAAPIYLGSPQGGRPTRLPGREEPCPDPSVCTPVPVFFGTDRKPVPPGARVDFSGSRDATTHLGQAIITVPRGAKRKLGSIARPTFWERAVLGVPARGDPSKHFTIAERGIIIYGRVEDFLQAVAERIPDSGDFREHAFVFIHGANTSFEFALYRTAQIAYDLGTDGEPFGTAFLFSWASEPGVENYKYDFDSARFAAERLSAFLTMIVEKTDAKRVHVIAHSMGNWPLLAALQEMPKTSKLGQVILAAPDVDAEEFTRMAARIVPVASGITLYTSSNDVAMVAARKVHRNTPRAGDVPSNGPVVVEGIDTIDVSSVSTEALSLAHSEYAVRRELLNDIALILRKGERPPSMRSPILQTVRLRAAQYWRFPAN